MRDTTIPVYDGPGCLARIHWSNNQGAMFRLHKAINRSLLYRQFDIEPQADGSYFVRHKKTGRMGICAPVARDTLCEQLAHA